MPGQSRALSKDAALTIREAVRRDLDAVIAIEYESFNKPYPPWYLEVLLQMAGRYFLVAEHGREIVGYAVAVPLKSGACHLVSIAVAPQARRRGIGTAMLRELEKRCRSDGYRAIVLEVEYTNLAAQRLYIRNGYRYAEVVPDYYGAGRHALHMVKPLRPREEH